MKRQILLLISVQIIFASCSGKKIFISSALESDWPWETIVFTLDQGHGEMLQLYRDENDIQSRLVEFNKTAKDQYQSDDLSQSININRNQVILQRNEQSIPFIKIKNSPKASSRGGVEDILKENYIVHANIHQVTYFDCREDSYCYETPYNKSVPSDTCKWYLIEFNGELFFSYTNTLRAIGRVYAGEGNLNFTYFNWQDTSQIVYNATLKMKSVNL